MRYLKTLGLLAVAALAMSAMLASTASAEGAKGTFTAGATPETHNPATIVGDQYPDPPSAAEEWNFFSRGGSENLVRCDTAKFTGTDADGIATSLTINPDYTHCFIQEPDGGTLPATVTMNECDYVFTQPTTIAPLGTGKYSGKADLTCKGTSRIVIHVYGFGNSTNTSHFFNACTIEVYPNAAEVGGHRTQELGGHIVYQNLAEGKDDVTVSGTVNQITSSTNCPGEAAHDANGEYRSTVTVKAFKDEVNKHNEQLDTWISDEEE